MISVNGFNKNLETLDPSDRNYKTPGIIVPSKNNDLTVLDIESDSALV